MNPSRNQAPSTPRILVVDDEAQLLEAITPFLSRSGFEVATADNGAMALEVLKEFNADLIVLDVLMPGIDGRELLRQLRASENWTPIILLTQVGNATERAMALGEGADDYLNKPYDPHELVARIQSVLRRSQSGEATLATRHELNSGALTFDRNSRIATLDGERLQLTPRANHLLEFLLLHPNELLTRERILDAVWGWQFETGTRSVDARIAELRKALKEDSAHPRFIETIPAEGYRFLASTDSK